jgi:hypothetical protein
MNDPMGGRIPHPNVSTITWTVMCVVGAAASWTVDAADGVIVRVDTACEAMAPDACLGAYGFRIAETGAYVAGPSPDGRARNGQAAENQLFVLARGALADPAKSAAACPPLGPIPGTRETVTVSLNEKTLVLKGDSGIIDKRCGETAGHLAEFVQGGRRGDAASLSCAVSMSDELRKREEWPTKLGLLTPTSG